MHYNHLKFVGKYPDLKNIGYTYCDWTSYRCWHKSVGTGDGNFRITKKGGGWLIINEFSGYEAYLLLFLINLRVTNTMLRKIKGYQEPFVYYASLYCNRDTGEFSTERSHEVRQMEARDFAEKHNLAESKWNWHSHFIRWDILEELVGMYDKGLIIPVISKETHHFG